jgi:putative copper export protein
MGGLLQFLLSGAAGSAITAERLRRVATISVAALVPAGVYGVFLHVSTLGDFVDTTYGWTLLAKIAVAIWVISLGARNHFVHVPALRRGHTAAFDLVRASVTVEVAGGVLALLLTALLGVLPVPPPTPHRGTSSAIHATTQQEKNIR